MDTYFIALKADVWMRIGDCVVRVQASGTEVALSTGNRIMEKKTMRKDAGFSLGELITIMGILSVMAAIAAPSLMGWRSNANLRRASQDLYSNFHKTKVEAARRNEFCAITFNAGNYTIYIDTNRDLDLDLGEEIIRTVNWSEYPGVSVSSTAFSSPSDSIGFSPRGFPMNNVPQMAGGSVTLTCGSNRSNVVTITPAGNITINRTG